MEPYFENQCNQCRNIYHNQRHEIHDVRRDTRKALPAPLMPVVVVSGSCLKEFGVRMGTVVKLWDVFGANLCTFVVPIVPNFKT